MAESAPLNTSMGTVELHHEAAAFGITAPGWVALSMLVVVAILIWQKVPAIVARVLDGRIAAIRNQLDEAKRLRTEAEALLADANAKTAASEKTAGAIVAHATAEAAALRAKAESDAAELIGRRQQMAEDRIAAAERGAIAEVRAKAASAAAAAAAVLIEQHHDVAADKSLIDKAIARLA